MEAIKAVLSFPQWKGVKADRSHGVAAEYGLFGTVELAEGGDRQAVVRGRDCLSLLCSSSYNPCIEIPDVSPNVLFGNSASRLCLR